MNAILRFLHRLHLTLHRPSDLHAAPISHLCLFSEMSGGGSGYQHNPIDWGDHGSSKRGRTVVVLLRHGETQWNQQGRFQGQLNSDLTKEGERQALLAAKRLGRRFKFDAVVSSDLGRAAQTADIVVKNRERPPLL